MTIIEKPQALGASVGAFVDELVRAGVRHFCVCPGSRSTPLALTIARHPGAKLWMHLDERSAGFFALGLAKAGRAPVALICTSGTAAANFLPAVVEAFYARVPLVVLTADRPHELRDVGAPQTIDQVNLFGSHAKWFVDLAEPDTAPDLLRYVRTVAGTAQEQLSKELGPGFEDLDLRDLNPKAFVQKHLMDDVDPIIADVKSEITDVGSTVRGSSNEVTAAINGAKDVSPGGPHDLMSDATPTRVMTPFDAEAT